MYKLLFFLVILYLFFVIFTRYILPWLLKIYLKRLMKKRFDINHEMFEEPQQNKNYKQKGEKYRAPGRSDTEDAEYVDYTEIKDNN